MAWCRQLLHRVDDISGPLRNDRLLRISAHVEHAGRPSPHSARHGMLLGTSGMRDTLWRDSEWQEDSFGVRLSMAVFRHHAIALLPGANLPLRFRRGRAGHPALHPVLHMDGTLPISKSTREVRLARRWSRRKVSQQSNCVELSLQQ